MKNKKGKEVRNNERKRQYKRVNVNELSEHSISVEETRKPFASSLLLRKQSKNPTSIISLLSLFPLLSFPSFFRLHTTFLISVSDVIRPEYQMLYLVKMQGASVK
jgi:hypothetical protein